MLTPGNRKLGADLIWGFGLPSGRASICVGMTPLCRKHCYAIRTEQYRVKARARYEANWRLARKRNFVRRMRAFLIAHHVRVVRIHTGGEFLCGRPHKNSYVAYQVMWRTAFCTVVYKHSSLSLHYITLKATACGGTPSAPGPHASA